MKLEYILEEQDFINYHLFSLSESKTQKRIKNIAKLTLMGFFLYFGITMYTSGKIEFAILLGIMAILGLLFFDKYYNYRLRKLYSTNVKNTYAKRIGKKETMEFTSDYIITEDKVGEGKMKISEVEKINETQANFFIRLSNGSALIISKKGIDNLEEIKNKWEELKIPVSENLSWEWK